MNEKELQRISQQAARVGVNAGTMAKAFRRVAEMSVPTGGLANNSPSAQSEVLACGEGVLNAQPETARRIVGKSRNGMTLWYQCEMCNEPVDAQDHFCRGRGRRLIDE